MAKATLPNTPNNPSSNVDYLWNIYTNITEWVRFSDTKAGAILVVNGTVFAIAFTRADQISALQANDHTLDWILTGAMICLLGSTLAALRCLLPTIRLRLKDKNSRQKHQSMIFFLHIADEYASAQAYIDAVRNNLVTTDQQITHLSEQIWANSRVACGKFESVKWAIWLLATTIFLTVVGSIIAVF